VDLLTYTMLRHELLNNQCGGGGFQERWRCPRRQKAGGARGLRLKSKISLAAYVKLTQSTNSKVDFQPSLLPRASPPSPDHCNFNTNLRGSELQTHHLSLSPSCSVQS
jgi:hypothetical protein